MSHEILTVAQCYEADKFADGKGVRTLILMENAGRAIADAVTQRWSPRKVAVLCGPGNNGGDGFVAARILRERGWTVRLALLGKRDALKGDAAAAAKRWTGTVEALSPDVIDDAELIVDAMFGAGLSRPLSDVAADVCDAANESRLPIVAVDVPSGIQGDSGEALGGICIHADVTVTFFRKKPAHVLMPGRFHSGEVVVADIGIPESAIDVIRPKLFENDPSLWKFPWPDPLGHKYARGHTIVVSGPAHATGAARLAARGALRVGSGLVSVASPPESVSANAAHLTAIMIKPFSGGGGLAELLKDERLNSVVIGPGVGVGRATQELVGAILATKASVVLDADALTSFKGEAKNLFMQLRENCVLTPHEGEFERVFPGLLKKSASRIEAARAAAAAAKCTVLLKGPDTVIAAPDGRAIVNSHAPATLATAGSGDVLSGLIGGLMAQGVDSYKAAACAAWLHGEAAYQFGPGLIAEDLPESIPDALSALKDELYEQDHNPPR
ncbi:MAG TPA: NAD(P)H-hydrate dehydratase [Rhizomicrobium sp.]|nr:NAD(P)H-hydrate dehydratase [Rhizomicrobium sp.]